jgi:hypothetical protein
MSRPDWKAEKRIRTALLFHRKGPCPTCDENVPSGYASCTCLDFDYPEPEDNRALCDAYDYWRKRALEAEAKHAADVTLRIAEYNGLRDLHISDLRESDRFRDERNHAREEVEALRAELTTIRQTMPVSADLMLGAAEVVQIREHMGRNMGQGSEGNSK